jgi:translation elongation factor P/translation initiation factor 5A
MTNKNGLVVTTSNDKLAQAILDESPFYFEYNSIEEFFFFPEENVDELEKELDNLFNQGEISARFEAQ